MVETMDTEPVHQERERTLDPWDYNAWVRSIERKMLAAEDEARAALVPDLVLALKETSDTVSLRPRDWHILLSLAHSEDAQSVLELHDRSTRDTFDISLFVRCASAWLCTWMHSSGQAFSIKSSGAATDVNGQPYNVPALVEAWTGIQFSGISSEGMYDAHAWPFRSGVTESNLRDALRDLYSRCAWHMSESHLVWDIYMEFERALLTADPNAERIQLVKQAYTARLQVPHRTLESTFQAFSSFVSTYLPSDEYESVMSSANRLYADALQMWHEREKYEDTVALSNTLEEWQPYLSWQVHRIKQLRTSKNKSQLATEEELGLALFRRAIQRFGQHPLGRTMAEAAEHADIPPTPDVEKRWKHKQGRKSLKMQEREHVQARLDARPLIASAESLWLDMAAMIHGPRVDGDAMLALCAQAVRTLPLSGRLWALYLRSLTRWHHSQAEIVALYEKATLPKGVALLGGTSLRPVLEARIDCERAYATLSLARAHNISPEDVHVETDVDHFMHIYELLVQAITAMQALPESEQDASLALERYTSDWIERAARALLTSAGPDAAAGLYTLADDLWTHALQQHALHALVYVEAAQYFQRRGDDKRARQTYKSGAGQQNVDNKVTILSSWVAFEHARGSLADIEHAEMKVKAENDKLWRQWYSYQAQASHPVAESVAAESESSKRKLEEHDELEPSKHQESQTAQPSRDREFSSVLVSGMPPNTTDADVRSFFRGYGVMYEVIGPKPVHEHGADSSAALIEFTDRDGAGAARTRDRKRMGDFEVRVVPSYACTLYVTNFPPDATDAMVRERFGKYGAIFDVRWPSRRFVQSRRFCYIQFVTEEGAHAALVEHGAHWQDDFALQVYQSNPMHKKQRSDANANDKELYVTGLPRSATADQLRQFFQPHTPVDDVRMPLRPDGKSRGIAFIQCKTPLDARRAMQVTNGTKFHGRLIAVTLADAGRSRKEPPAPDTDWRARSIHVAGLPPDAQEPLIQQAIETAVGPNTVRRVFWTPGREPNAQGTCDSMVEMTDQDVAGRAVLSANATYGSMPLTLSMHQQASNVPSASTRGGRRNALGFSRVHTSETTDTTPKDQDAFRQMLHKSK